MVDTISPADLERLLSEAQAAGAEFALTCSLATAVTLRMPLDEQAEMDAFLRCDAAGVAFRTAMDRLRDVLLDGGAR